MSLRYGVACLLLLLGIVVLSSKNYDRWMLPIKVADEKGIVKKSGTTVESSPLFVGQKEKAPVGSYLLLAEKNIFHPERKDFPILSPSIGDLSKKTVTRPQIVLYGVMLNGDYQSASVANPGRQMQKGEREIMTLKVGDRIGEYQLVQILPDRIMVEGPEDKFEVLLYDSKIQKKRTYVKTEVRPTAATSSLPPQGLTSAETPRPTPLGRPDERGVEAQGPRPLTPTLSPSSTTTPSPLPLPRPRRRIAPIVPPASTQVDEGEGTD
jgi:hypothetical protein